jgi:hypothetical protein
MLQLGGIDLEEICSKQRKAFWKDGERGMDLFSLFALSDGLEVAETSITGPVLTLSLVASEDEKL